MFKYRKKYYLNKKYKKETIKYILLYFEYYFGLDISKYIFSFIQIKNIEYCSICCYYIRINYFICNKCNNNICLKCYTSFKDLPLCYEHLDYNKYSNILLTMIKKRLLKMIRKKLKNKSVNLLRVISKHNDDIFTALYYFDMNRQSIHLPTKKYIKKHFFVSVQESTLNVVFIDSLNDTYFYDLF